MLGLAFACRTPIETMRLNVGKLAAAGWQPFLVMWCIGLVVRMQYGARRAGQPILLAALLCNAARWLLIWSSLERAGLERTGEAGEGRPALPFLLGLQPTLLVSYAAYGELERGWLRPMHRRWQLKAALAESHQLMQNAL